MNPNRIIITVKNVYGNDLIYPVCAKAQTFAALTGKKTFDHADLCNIEALGFEIVQSTLPLAKARSTAPAKDGALAVADA